MNRKLRQLTTRMLAVLVLFLCASNSWSLTTGAANRAPMDVSVYDYDGTTHTDSVEDRQAVVALTPFTYDDRPSRPTGDA